MSWVRLRQYFFLKLLLSEIFGWKFILPWLQLCKLQGWDAHLSKYKRKEVYQAAKPWLWGWLSSQRICMALAPAQHTWHESNSLDFRLLSFLWEGSPRLILLGPPDCFLVGLRVCFLSRHHVRSNLLRNTEWGRRGTSAGYCAHTTSLQGWGNPRQVETQFAAFFLATTHFKNQNPHTITKTQNTPETPYPCRMLHCFTHSFWRSKNLQEKQWKGPGPQQPTSEHRGSQTCLAAAHSFLSLFCKIFVFWLSVANRLCQSMVSA